MEKERIVVMGGSFNPPTIAHFRLMESAVQQLNACKGFFIPVSQAYLKRKMRKTKDSNICISEEYRMLMLDAMCAENPLLAVSEMELNSIHFRTHDTMAKLQEMYPDMKLYFLSGADKLELIARWSETSDFFLRFYIVMFSREGADLESQVRNDERLCRFYDRFVFLPQPEGIDGISATAVRKYLMEGKRDCIGRYLHPSAWEILQGLPEDDFIKEIGRFQGEYEFLSNSYPAEIKWREQNWLCAESAFQAAKCSSQADFLSFVSCNALRAKRRSSKIKVREDWEAVKIAVMEEIVYAKFTQHPELAKRLKNTGKAVLVAGNNGKDTFWGRDLYSDRGENQLGKILMKLRDKILD